MRNGFTLIELLAVIVILAIIALIATPIILEVISNTKEEAVVRSAENYLKAVELSIATEAMNDSTKKLDGTYQIISNGKEIQKGTETPIKVEYDGEGLEKGKITIKDGKITRVMNAIIGNQTYVKTLSGETMILDYESEEVTLLSGQNFNSAIKTLVLGNDTKVSHGTSDQIVTSIEFLSYGMLPEGYTLKELKKMEHTDVSAGNDNKIMAYYDGNDKVFIYSEGLINFNQDSNSMFMVFKNVEKIIFNEIDTSQVKYMQSMFHSCSSLIELDLSSFNTSNVTEMYSMFAWCSGLTKLNVSSFDTRNVTKMYNMFYNCSKLTELDVSNFDTGNVTEMYSMFQNCQTLEELDVSNFNTSKVTSMLEMFKSCKSLTELDVSSFNTDNVTNMYSMFAWCSGLTKLNVSSFDTRNVTKMDNMFMGVTKLQNLNMSSFIFNELVSTTDMFYGAKAGMDIIVRGETQKTLVKSLHTSANVTTK